MRLASCVSEIPSTPQFCHVFFVLIISLPSPVICPPASCSPSAGVSNTGIRKITTEQRQRRKKKKPHSATRDKISAKRMHKIPPDSPSCCRAFADDGDDGDDKGPAHIYTVDCHGKCATRQRKGATYAESASRSPTALLGRGGEGCSAVLLGPGVPLRTKTFARSLPLLPETRAAEVRTPPRPTAPLLKKRLSASSEREAR